MYRDICHIPLAPFDDLTTQAANLVCGEILNRATPSDEDLERHLRLDDEQYYGVILDDTLLAVGALASHPDGLQISFLATRPDCQDQGHGTRLLQELEEIAAAQADRVYTYALPAVFAALKAQGYVVKDPDARSTHGNWFYKDITSPDKP
jgi:ribosomal protein S18 acetylase RimI-like enzyme